MFYSTSFTSNAQTGHRFFDKYYQKILMYDRGEILFSSKKLSAYEEKLEIIDANKLNIERDQICYVISRKWFQDWKRYVQYDDVNEKEAGCSRPEKIDNLHLISNSSEFVLSVEKKTKNNATVLPLPRLKRNVSKNVDYEVVNSKVWEKLYSWYGGHTLGHAPAIPGYSHRTSITNAEVIIDVYPAIFMCAYVHNLKDCVQFKEFRVFKNFTFGELRVVLMGYHNINPRLSSCRVADSRLWIAKAGEQFSPISSGENQVVSDVLDYDSSSFEKQEVFVLLEPRFLTENFQISCNMLVPPTRDRSYTSYTSYTSYNPGGTSAYQEEDSSSEEEKELVLGTVAKAKTIYITISPPDLEDKERCVKEFEKNEKEFLEDFNRRTIKKFEGRSYRSEYITKKVNQIWKSEPQNKSADSEQPSQMDLYRNDFKIECKKETFVFCRNFMLWNEECEPAEIYIIQLLPGLSKDIDRNERKEYVLNMEYDMSGVEVINIVGCMRLTILKIFVFREEEEDEGEVED